MKRLFRKALSGGKARKVAAAATGALTGLPAVVLAWAVPAAGDFGFEFYDFAVNTFLHGAFGSLFCLGLCVGGFAMGMSSRAGGWAAGIPVMILGGALYNIDALATALGLIV